MKNLDAYITREPDPLFCPKCGVNVENHDWGDDEGAEDMGPCDPAKVAAYDLRLADERKQDDEMERLQIAAEEAARGLR